MLSLLSFRLGRIVLFLAVLGLASDASIQSGLAVAPIQDQSKQGERWVGWLETKSQNLRLAVNLSSTEPGNPSGTILSLDQSSDPLPIANATIDSKRNLSFEVGTENGATAAYKFQGSIERDRLVGQIQQAGVKLPIEFTKATSLPEESTDRLGANSAWVGALDVGSRKVPLRLRIYSSAPYASSEKPRVLLDSLLENANGFPVSVSVNDGGAFEFSIPAIPGNAKYVAELSQDQKTLVGKFQQGFLPLQLNMVRVAELESKDPSSDAMVLYLSGLGKDTESTSETTTEETKVEKETSKTAKNVDAQMEEQPSKVASVLLPNGLQEQTFTVERFDSRKPLLNEQGKRADNSFLLEGTVTFPKGFTTEGRFPAVVLVTGSGPQDRDETIGKHKPFRDIAIYLATQGMVVIRYDDRGVGNSTGDYVNSTSLDFADDALAVWQFARGIEGIDRSRVGLLGHSEGGVIGPMVAAWQREVAFMILIAPPVLPGTEILSSQIDRIAELEGVGVEDRAATKGLQEELQRIALRFPADNESGLSEVRKAVAQRWESLSRISQSLGGSDDEKKKLVVDAITAQFRGLQTPWMKHFLAYDPSSNWVLFDCPVLAIWAEKDTQVLYEANRKKLAEIVSHNMNMKADLVVLPGLNHLLQRANTGLPDEYDRIDQSIDPLALETFGNWLKDRKILP